jgi:Cu-processing system permease protein
MNIPAIIIARLTFREATRRRIVQAGLVLGLLFLLVFGIGFHFFTTSIMTPQQNDLSKVIKAESNNILTIMGLYAVGFMAVALGTLISADSLASEISSGTVQTLTTKPIRRSDLVLGKWLGIAALLALYLILMAGGVVASVWLQTGYTPPHLLNGLFFMYLEGLIVMSVALMFGSRISALATGGVVFGLYGIAFIGGWVEELGALLKNQGAINIGIISSLIMPSETIWRRAAYEMQSPIASTFNLSPFSSVSVPSTAMIIYGVLFMMTTVIIAIWQFNHRDL